MSEWLAYFVSILPDFYSGMIVSILLTAVGLALGFVLGLLAAMGRIYGPKWLRWLCVAYIELFRGTPLLVQLFVVYYGFPDFGLTLSRMTAAYLVMGLNSGAYQAEYFRGAIQAIGHGQMTAALALGMKRNQAILHIILPQALRLVVPAWSNEPVSLLKCSAVAFLIAVPDLMTRAKTIVAHNYDPIGTYFAVAVVYLALVFVLTALLQLLEKKLEIPGFSLQSQRSH